MSKILAVFGATGQQGSSVINNVLDDPELSKQYKLRAITRQTTTDSAKKLASKLEPHGGEVVSGDATDRASLDKALQGVHFVFSMSTPVFGPDGFEAEYNAGKNIADAAVAQGAEYIIFSTLPNVSEISGGKYTQVTHSDAKAAVEKYIRTLPIKSAFFNPGGFFQNLHNLPFVAPQKGPDGTYTMTRPNAPSATWPWLDAVADTGKFVGAILAQPASFDGKVIAGVQKLYRNEELAEIISKATGKKVVYKQISVEEFKAGMPFAQDLFAQLFCYADEFGFYGQGQEELIRWSVQNARGRLSTLEDYLERNPLRLE